jgi:hypothetical protein
VVEGCEALLDFLRRGDRRPLEVARAAFAAVVSGDRGTGDLDARWVAAHLLSFTDDADSGSLWSVLPPFVPGAVRQAFTIASPNVLVLWPPQRELLSANGRPSPVGSAQRRLLMALPTSAGKTLMAQMMVVTHLASQSTSVCYVTPLRSLAREVRRSLRSRLTFLQRELGRDLPDVDAVASAALAVTADDADGERADSDDADVEVMTPERLASLLHRDAESVLNKYGLFIFDEAHLLGSSDRGFLFESVLTFLHWRTQQTGHRLVLLSAALGNRAQVVAWLNGGDDSALYSSEWRGPRRLHAVFGTEIDRTRLLRRESVKNKAAPTRVVYPLRGAIRLRTAEGLANVRLDFTDDVGESAFRLDAGGSRKPGTDGRTPTYEVVARLATALGHAGAMLIVTTERDDAVRIATAVANRVPDSQRAVPLADLVRTRLGAEHPLVALIPKGVAFHHAGLPTDVLDAVEEGLRDDVLRYVACTSTLTEGVNLPVRTVIIAEKVYSGQPEGMRLNPARLVNAIGRAGRAGRESEGWIINALAHGETPSDFDWADIGPADLVATSRLASEQGLEALAIAEETLRASADALFSLHRPELDDFVSFVWFILTSEEAIGKAPNSADVVGAIESTLGFAQLSDHNRDRWLAVAETVRSTYTQADPIARRRWTRAGTSIGTARGLDAIALDIAAEIVNRVTAIREVPAVLVAEDLLPIEKPTDAVDLLHDLGVFEQLFALPECPRQWRFRYRRNSPSSDSIPLEPRQLLQEWLDGRSVPQMSELLPMDVAADWRLDQIVDVTTQLFEHFLSWTLGVVIEQVNAQLGTQGLPERLCPGLSAFVRYGVDRSLAVELLTSGVGSRVLAQRIAVSAERESVEVIGLRSWLGRMSIPGWRDRFDASSSELLDLLEYTRSRRTGILRLLLETGTSTIAVVPLPDAPASPSPAGSPTEDQARFVFITSDPDAPPPSALMVRASDQTGELLALIPPSSHSDVETLLTSGVTFDASLLGDGLSFRLVLD